MAKRIGLTAASVAAIAACVWLAWPSGGRVPRSELLRPHVCEACGHRFMAVPGRGPVTCPKCQKQDTARVHEYVCGACGARFEAFRERKRGGADAPPIIEHKRPGGAWAPATETLPPITCPKCRSTNVAPATSTSP